MKKRIALSLDVNGPLTPTDDVTLKPFEGVADRLLKLKKAGVSIFLNSGWDVYTLQLIDRLYLGSVCDGFIGEHGRTYKLKGKEVVIVSQAIREADKIKLFKKNVEVCAKEGIHFALQNNITNMAFYYDSEQKLKDYVGRKKTASKSKISFELENLDWKSLLETVTYKYAMVSMKAKMEGNTLTFFFNPESKGMSIEDVENTAKKISLSPWRVNNVHDDFCVEYVMAESNNVHKGTGLEEAMKDYFGKTDDVIVFGIGDGAGDLNMKMTSELNVVFYGLKGTKAEKNADFTSDSGIEFLDKIYNISQQLILDDKK